MYPFLFSPVKEYILIYGKIFKITKKVNNNVFAADTTGYHNKDNFEIVHEVVYLGSRFDK